MDIQLLKEWVLAVFFPSRCLLCGRVVGFCENTCAACGPIDVKQACRRILLTEGKEQKLVFCVAPFLLQSDFRQTLYDFKFSKNRDCVYRLSKLMAECAEEFPYVFHGVAFVPMTDKQRRKRGQNQSEILAKAVAKQLGLPLTACLEKVRETEVQHDLPKDMRQKNVRGAYGCRENMKEKNLLLVDDVLTTGATVRECARALYRQGAARVCTVCAAFSEKDAMGISPGERKEGS